MDRITHLNERGEAHMVDVGEKQVTARQATARGYVWMKPETLEAMTHGRLPKGDVFATARIAGIMAAKRTSDLIPLCHPLPISSVSVDIEPLGDGVPEDPDGYTAGVRVRSTVSVTGRTGVEMEALTSVSVACLTIYDMAKAVDKGMIVSEILLEEKTGGKSGPYTRTGNRHEGEQ